MGVLFRLELRLGRSAAAWLSGALFLFQFGLTGFYAGARPDRTFADLFAIIPEPVKAFMGSRYVDVLSLRGFLAFALTHPMSLVFLCAAALIPASRAAPSETDTGLGDLIHVQPLSRARILAARTAAAAFTGLFVAAALWAGQAVGLRVMPLPDRPPALPYLFAAANAYALFLAVLGLGVLMASLTRGRARAVGTTLAVLLFMLFLKLAGEVWPALDPAARLSLFQYYIPGKIVYSGAFPGEDVTVLLLFAAAALFAAVYLYRRRDL